jgi:hypothetical protein
MPTTGLRVLGFPRVYPNGKKGFKHRSYETNEEATKAALKLDHQGETVYFAVHGFGDWYKDPKSGNLKIRKADNVVACRSLIDDYDVSPDKNAKARAEGKPEPCYETKKDAFDDLVRFAKELRLTPTIVSSGGGYHTYITLDEDISADDWVELSRMKRDILRHLKIKFDPMVDKDPARILRPVGTHNYKYDEPVEVTALKLGKVYPVETVRQRLQDYTKEHGVEPSMERSYATNNKADNPFAAALGDFPPSDPHKVAERCAAVRAMRDEGGDIPEPHWWAAIGVLRFCEGGEEIIHEWSSGYDGYSYEETQTKIDTWEVGSTSCEKMNDVIGCKADCPFADKCKYPVQLGYTEEAESVSTETKPSKPPFGGGEDDDTTASNKPPKHKSVTIEGQVIPYWPATGYRWNGVNLSKAHVDEEGLIHWTPFCKAFAYPINRIRDSEGKWVIHWRAKEKNGDWREFFMPTAELASTDMMAKTLAANEVFLARTKNARGAMAEFTETLIQTLQEWRVETKTYKQLGWTEDKTGFVLGNTIITEKGEEPVLCDDNMPSDIAGDFGTSGTLDEWIDNIDVLYNRPGAEPFQFALCHSMGSALVDFFESSNWHGIPLAFTGHGGTGKSTASKIACGFYGRPKLMERQTGEQGSTLGAAIKRLSVMGSIPMLLDEFSGRSADELTRTGYALANGRDKERLKNTGGFSTMGDEWYKNSFITSNDGIHETISKLPAGYKVEATQLRFFEVQLPKDYRTKIFPDISQSFIEHHMDHVYGHACRPFIRFLIKNQKWVKRQIVAARDKFNPKSADDNKERFYRDAIVTALVAGKIAERLGLINFDVNAMKKWALNHVVSMRDSRKENNISTAEHLSKMISSLNGRLIVTKHVNDGRSSVQEMPLAQIRGPVVGRVCTEDKVVYLASAAITEYCKDNGIQPSAIREEMDRANLLVPFPNGKLHHTVRLGAGTTEASTVCRAYQLNYDLLYYGKSLKLAVNNQQTKTN